jgi:hypothetical protein
MLAEIVNRTDVVSVHLPRHLRDSSDFHRRFPIESGRPSMAPHRSDIRERGDDFQTKMVRSGLNAPVVACRRDEQAGLKARVVRT